jgi:hypothetical protein
MPWYPLRMKLTAASDPLCQARPKLYRLSRAFPFSRMLSQQLQRKQKRRNASLHPIT